MSFLSGSSLPASSAEVKPSGNRTGVLVLLCQLVSQQFSVKVFTVVLLLGLLLGSNYCIFTGDSCCIILPEVFKLPEQFLDK